MDVKKCAVCGIEKPLTAYTKRSSGSSRRGTCRSCMRKRQREIIRNRAGGEPGHAAAIAEQQPGGSEPAAAIAQLHTVKPEGDAVSAQQRPGNRKPLAAPAGNVVIWPDPPDKKKRSQAPVQVLEPVESAAEEEEEEEGESPAKRKRRKRGRRRKTGRRTEGFIDETSAKQQVSGYLEPGAAPIENNAVPKAEISAAKPAEERPVLASEAAEGETAPKRKRRQRGRKRRKRSAKAVVVTAEPEVDKRPPNKRIVPFKGPFKYDPSILNDRGTGMIRLRGRRETGKRWSTDIPLEMAISMVKEGAAGILSPGLIHKLYSKTDFRLLVLQRDNYVCRYCGRFGDTIDHVMPKSKGGLSSPANCVCACADCNLKKADSLDFVYDDF